MNTPRRMTRRRIRTAARRLGTAGLAGLAGLLASPLRAQELSELVTPKRPTVSAVRAPALPATTYRVDTPWFRSSSGKLLFRPVQRGETGVSPYVRPQFGLALERETIALPSTPVTTPRTALPVVSEPRSAADAVEPVEVATDVPADSGTATVAPSAIEHEPVAGLQHGPVSARLGRLIEAGMQRRLEQRRYEDEQRRMLRIQQHYAATSNREAAQARATAMVRDAGPTHSAYGGGQGAYDAALTTAQLGQQIALLAQINQRNDEGADEDAATTSDGDARVPSGGPLDDLAGLDDIQLLGNDAVNGPIAQGGGKPRAGVNLDPGGTNVQNDATPRVNVGGQAPDEKNGGQPKGDGKGQPPAKGPSGATVSAPDRTRPRLRTRPRCRYELMERKVKVFTVVNVSALQVKLVDYRSRTETWSNGNAEERNRTRSTSDEKKNESRSSANGGVSIEVPLPGGNATLGASHERSSSRTRTDGRSTRRSHTDTEKYDSVTTRTTLQIWAEASGKITVRRRYEFTEFWSPTEACPPDATPKIASYTLDGDPVEFEIAPYTFYTEVVLTEWMSRKDLTEAAVKRAGEEARKRIKAELDDDAFDYRTATHVTIPEPSGLPSPLSYP